MTPEEWAAPISASWADEEPGRTIHRQFVETIREAVAEERERCAKLAASFVHSDPYHSAHAPEDVVAETKAGIAAAIRGSDAPK